NEGGAAENTSGLLGSAYSGKGGGSNNAVAGTGDYTISSKGRRTSGGTVENGGLWGIDDLTVYQTADIDICVDESIGNLKDMYWQTSNQDVIESFYNGARTWLGYENEQCRYPKIKGTGTTVVTAGTYDGARRDSITITVIAPPVEQWKRDVLNLVNQERAKNGLGALEWGYSCEMAAMTRAMEIVNVYSHTRPDGSEWSTACPIPSSGGASGENLAAGNGAVSPETVVATWMASTEHRANILNGDFTKMAVGFEFEPGAQYQTYWSEVFSTY
ncbi:CAP domain-containing protein, partial [Candidatus Saccharibacteria bacterium]|nr:CAP domain-containing protein [Candidatus Saccharibacteria bacterium]